MVTYSLSISPQKPHYGPVWFDTVLTFIRERSTKFIFAEEHGSHSEPTHLQIALELEPHEVEAFNRTLQNRIRDLPGRGDKTKVMRKNPNAFKYVCKEEGRKVYEGFEEADIVQLAAEYARESGIAAGGNYPFLCLAKKVCVPCLGGEAEELLDEPVSTIAATLLSQDLITFKEYNRCKNNSALMRINIDRMKLKWREAVESIRREILAVETQKVAAINEARENQRKYESAKRKAEFLVNPVAKRPIFVPTVSTNEEAVDMDVVEEKVQIRVAELDPEEIL